MFGMTLTVLGSISRYFVECPLVWDCFSNVFVMIGVVGLEGKATKVKYPHYIISTVHEISMTHR